MPHARHIVFCSLVVFTLILGPAASQFVTDNDDSNDVETMSIIFCTEELVRSVPHQLQLLQSLQSQMTSFSREIGELKRTIAALEAQVASQSSSMERVLQLLEQISASNERLNTKVDNLQAKFEQESNKIDSKRQQLTNERIISVSPQRSASLELKMQTLHTEGLPSSCAVALESAGAGAHSGVYTLHLPHSGLAPFAVYCLRDPEGGRGWTVVQRRINGKTDFYRGWQEYKAGFGDVRAEYFIGLDRLHALTSTAPGQQLWVQLEASDANASARYSHFGIGDESEKYALNVLSGYTGDAGDSLVYQKGQHFSTMDNDNDARNYGNCAVTFRGAWWYNDCHTSNLNGIYLHGQLQGTQYAQAIVWKTFRGETYGLKYAHMAIRPREASNPVSAEKQITLSHYLKSRPSQGHTSPNIKSNPFLKQRTAVK